MDTLQIRVKSPVTTLTHRAGSRNSKFMVLSIIDLGL